ncbi:MAG: T9SS type A sorting domain-containing protein [Breznakibacter sp.]
MRKDLRRMMVLLIAVMMCGASMAQRQMENLGRGLVAVYTGSGVFLSWRILGTEFSSTSFNVYRNGTKIATTSASANSNYTDASGTTGNTYYVSPVVNGTEGTASATVTSWGTIYKSITLSQPAGGTSPDGVAYTYMPNDCSVGDLDGDDEYELVVKWDPSNSKDNSASGYTGPVYLDAYEMDGTLKWRINLGINVRAGAHYTQFIVYDLNGDGQAEVAFRGAPGTTDNSGTVIGGTTDYRNSSGYVLSGPEYLCIASGASGRIVKYATFYPARGTVSAWGDTYGNRCDRFLAGVAYLDGVTPSLIMARGYYLGTVSGTTYGQTKIVAYNYSGNTITQKWAFDAVYGSTNSAYAGQGNHQLTCADIDNDGYDEIVYGSMTVDHNGTGKYSTGLGHGDMLNVGDLNPNLSGKEVWAAHEEGIGATFRSASTGTTLWKFSSTGDVGRALSADIDATYVGEECWAAGTGLYNCTGTSYGTAPTYCNSAVWWDGDVQRELLNGTTLDKWSAGSTNRVLTLYNYGSSTSINGTKKNACLTADIFGDWREEIILPSSDGTKLNIFTTTTPSSVRMYTLMHDYQYRTGVAGENVAYNSTPRLSFYFGGGMGTITAPNITLKSAGLAEPSINNTKIALNVWPNPVVDGFLRLDLTMSVASDIRAEVYDITGKLVLSDDLGRFEAGNWEHWLDLAGLKKGMYVLRVVTAEGNSTAKINKM